MNIPNTLTLSRIALIPVLVAVFYIPWEWSHLLAGFVFGLAGVTDWLDGYLARTLGQSTPLGAFLDPVADKLMVCVALVLLVGDRSLPYLAMPAAIIICREIAISALREWMAELGKRASVAVSIVGKVKTTLQIMAVVTLLAYSPAFFPIWILYLGYAALYAAAIFTLWSMVMYLRAAWPDLVGPGVGGSDA